MDQLPTEHRRAKRPATVLAGPYGHPVHAMVIPVPIGAWVASLLFDLASYIASEPTGLLRGSYWLIVLGIATALLAAVFGLMDLVRIPLGTKPFKVGVAHMMLNVTVVALYTVGVALRHGRLDDAPLAIAPLAVSIVAVGLLAVSGWLGGELTYRYGIRVADESTQADAYAKRQG
ncbi:MAG: DUF2231 domain-containing protein [Actinomycetota bacterium]|nr:DUF2231 domain-containing protein [Actinomycetota bacterium]